MSTHDLCYQCYKHGPGCLFGKFRIKDFNDEPHSPQIIKLVSSQININSLFNTNYERKIRKCDKRIHKDMIITVEINQTNKSYLLQFNQKMNIDRNLQIIYGYHFLTNHSRKL